MTDNRVFERHDDSFGAYYDATAILERTTSPYQQIDVIETARHGRVMLIDGLTMLTERTHHTYHEHMTHLPLACLAAPRDVLVIGGGDGGAVTELVKHADLERIHMVELDGTVVEAGRRWFPEISAGLNDPRVTLTIGDGAAYLAAHPGAFDLVVIDSTDICEEAADTDTASPLATDAFFDDVKRALKPGGVAIQVLGSTVFYTASMQRLLPRLAAIWPRFKPVMMACPFYITGHWTAGLYSLDNALTPTRFPLDPGVLEVINPDTAAAALALPNAVSRMLKGSS